MRKSRFAKTRIGAILKDHDRCPKMRSSLGVTAFT